MSTYGIKICRSMFRCAVLLPAFLSSSLSLGQEQIWRYEYVPSADDPWTGMMMRGSGLTGRVEVKAWDSWSDIGAPGDIINPHGHEIGEDMILAPGRSGRISDLGFTIVNRTGQNVIGSLFTRYSCYSDSGTLLFSHTIEFYFDPSFPLFTGSGALVHVGSGLLYQTGDVVPDRCSFSITISSTDFPRASELEQFTAPLIIGSSSELYHDFTIGSDIFLPRRDTLMMFVATQPVPTSGSAIVLLAALPVSFRRRR
jgi:hypothetical protein